MPDKMMDRPDTISIGVAPPAVLDLYQGDGAHTI